MHDSVDFHLNCTSIHPATCELAFVQLVLLIKESEGGQNLSRADILRLLHRAIDVVFQFQRRPPAFSSVGYWSYLVPRVKPMQSVSFEILF